MENKQVTQVDKFSRSKLHFGSLSDNKVEVQATDTDLIMLTYEANVASAPDSCMVRLNRDSAATLHSILGDFLQDAPEQAPSERTCATCKHSEVVYRGYGDEDVPIPAYRTCTSVPHLAGVRVPYFDDDGEECDDVLHYSVQPAELPLEGWGCCSHAAKGGVAGGVCDADSNLIHKDLKAKYLDKWIKCLDKEEFYGEFGKWYQITDIEECMQDVLLYVNDQWFGFAKNAVCSPVLDCDNILGYNPNNREDIPLSIEV